jgi:cyclase
MKRFIALASVLAIGATSITVAAQRGGGAPAPKVATIEKIKDGLYLLTGTDRGVRLVMTAFVMSDGVAVIDTGYPGWGNEWLAKIKTVTDKPVTVVINTHNHSDHTGSDSEMGANVLVVAQENTRANLARETCNASTGGCSEFKGEKAKFLPSKTFKDRMTMFSGHDQMDFYYNGLAHTNCDTVIVFPALRAAAVGDLFAWRGVPRVMTDDGGSMHDFPETLSKQQAAVKNVDVVTSGHSKVMQWADWVEYKDFLTEYVKQISASYKAGKTVDEAVAALSMPEKFKLCDPKSTVTTELATTALDCKYRSDQAKADAQILYDELKAGAR